MAYTWRDLVHISAISRPYLGHISQPPPRGAVAIARLRGGAPGRLDARVARGEQLARLPDIAVIAARLCDLVARDEQIELLQEIAEIARDHAEMRLRSRRDPAEISGAIPGRISAMISGISRRI